jgi:hypothetical protein
MTAAAAATTISSDFRCDAESQPFGDPVRRCDRSGSRYREGRWLCPRCFGLPVVRYVCGDRHEAARVPVATGYGDQCFFAKCGLSPSRSRGLIHSPSSPDVSASVLASTTANPKTKSPCLRRAKQPNSPSPTFRS